MVTVPRLWPGGTVVCLATGPSLTQDDCDYVRGRAHVIAVNDAHRLAPWADMLYSSDRRWWAHYKAVPSFEGLRYGIGTSPRLDNQVRGYPQIQVLKNTGYDGLELKPHGLRNGRNSGFAAVNLAVHTGAVRIVLLGYNMSYLGGKAHFFGNHPSRLEQTEARYPSFRRLFATMVDPLKTLGVDVINCTEQTSLTAFPRRRLRDVLAVAEAVAC